MGMFEDNQYMQELSNEMAMKKADDKDAEQAKQARIQVSAGLEQSNALLTNDSAIGYIPPAYEMSMLHSYKALNYVYKLWDSAELLCAL